MPLESLTFWNWQQTCPCAGFVNWWLKMKQEFLFLLTHSIKMLLPFENSVNLRMNCVSNCFLDQVRVYSKRRLEFFLSGFMPVNCFVGWEETLPAQCLCFDWLNGNIAILYASISLSFNIHLLPARNSSRQQSFVHFSLFWLIIDYALLAVKSWIKLSCCHHFKINV